MKTQSRTSRSKNQTEFDDKLLFDKKSAATVLSISVRQLEYHIAKNEVEVRRIGKRVLITRAALAQFARVH